MYTYQAIALADQNGRTYTSNYGKYNKENGFVLKNYGISGDIEDLIYELFHEDCWSLAPRKMTKEEIEEKLGYQIEIEEKVGKNKTSQNKKDMNYNNFFGYFWQ